jgi:NADH-quinone oxidoreductase subunit C
VHGVDYYPEEPRLGVQYELIDMDALDRLTVKLRVPTDARRGAVRGRRVADRGLPGARGLRHVRRRLHGHPDLRRILMPEDYEGIPQRRDFPIGGEPVLFTRDEAQERDYTQ